MEFARMDSLSRLFPSDLEFQSGRNFIPLLFEIEIQIEKTVDSYWHNTSREVSVYPDTFISAPFLRFSRQIEFDAIFVFLLLPFFFYDRRKEKKTSKRIEINRTLFPKGIDESIRSLCMIDRWHFLDLEENATIIENSRFESNLERRITDFFNASGRMRGDFSFTFFSRLRQNW